jgi:hypothetical protein
MTAASTSMSKEVVEAITTVRILFGYGQWNTEASRALATLTLFKGLQKIDIESKKQSSFTPEMLADVKKWLRRAQKKLEAARKVEEAAKHKGYILTGRR